MTSSVVDIKGIPEFWLVAFKNAPTVADMIEVIETLYFNNFKIILLVLRCAFKAFFYT